MLQDLHFRKLAYFSYTVKRAGGGHEEVRGEAKKPVRRPLH